MSAPSAKIHIPEVLDDFAAYVLKNPAWGSLHIVLDDGNIHDDHVRWCIGHAEETGDAEGARLGRILLQMSKSQRMRIAAKAEAVAVRAHP